MITDKPLVIGIVAGEVSGDSLGADFMQQMNELTDNIRWVGVGGTKMQQQGLESIFDMSRLSVMGLLEVIKHLPDLFRARRELLTEFKATQIDCFVGIDAPDFNLRLSKKLKPQGIYCVQYVSPSIWAWRESRIEAIKKATDLVLCLFPFELAVYEKHGHPAVCVGHPLLNTIDKSLLTLNTQAKRKNFIWKHPIFFDYFSSREQGISDVITVMPGSRHSEVNALMPLMLDTIEQLLRLDKDLYFLIPAVNQQIAEQIEQIIYKHVKTAEQEKRLQNAINILCDESISNLSQQVMAMADVVLLASGTATLEAMLLNRPMVVIYRLNWLTYQIAKRLIKVPYVALPNILADDEIVPELIQSDATADNIARQVWQTLHTDRAYEQQVTALEETTRWLRQQSGQSPAHVFIEHFTHVDYVEHVEMID
ncbi:MAG: lipid-A-disaccharide synthase [Pseudomonadales bacterium]|nr:MAG: lipid-A-disaccharide synthase [Pseudomonadales bacterium]